jgi:hypothetical protein
MAFLGCLSSMYNEMYGKQQFMEHGETNKQRFTTQLLSQDKPLNAFFLAIHESSPLLYFPSDLFQLMLFLPI